MGGWVVFFFFFSLLIKSKERWLLVIHGKKTISFIRMNILFWGCCTIGNLGWEGQLKLFLSIGEGFFSFSFLLNAISQS